MSPRRRRSARTRALLAPALAALSTAGCGGPEAEARADEVATVDERLATDPRLRKLLADCPKSGYYGRDTSDVVPILLEKLEDGFPDPMHRAKEELGALGELSIEELARMVQRSYADPNEGPALQNALDAVVMNDTPRAHDVLMECRVHPRETVRLVALRGLAGGHAMPEDFDALVTHLDFESSPQVREVIVRCLHEADAARAEALFVSWLGEGSHADLWSQVAPRIVGSENPGTAELCREAFPSATGRARLWTAVGAARAGDEEALAFLRETWLESEEPDLRAAAFEGIAALGRVEDMGRQLLHGSHPTLRYLAARGLAQIEDDERITSYLRQGVDDPDPSVGTFCLHALVRRGDRATIDRALAMLERSLDQLRTGMEALAPLLPEDPELARETLERLYRRNDAEAHRTLESRMATLQAIGRVPSAEAARFLRELALENLDARPQGRRAHRWLTIHAANSGREGRAWLASQVAEESDPLRRLDLIWAATSDAERSDQTREWLLAWVEDGDAHPYERLFCADRLARVGPASIVAPRLKRVCYRIEHPEARRAFQCLLWTWY